MENKKNIDFLALIEESENGSQSITTPEGTNSEITNIEEEILEIHNNTENTKGELKNRIKILSSIWFLTRYICTTALIFSILLVSTNYQAYYNIAMSYINAEELESKSQGLISSVQASNISSKIQNQYIEKQIIIENEKEKIYEKNSIKQLLDISDKNETGLHIEITPYENRIVIPKIGKNIPLIDIKNRTLSDSNELNNIFMKELENGVVRYPGSARPGKNGNTFIFGHSSNFPWMKGDYNDVFSLLDKVSFNDEIIIYYNQKKYSYLIREKQVITPGDTSVLSRNKNKSEITLMTCWPIGTTLNRLIVTGELIEVK